MRIAPALTALALLAAPANAQSKLPWKDAAPTPPAVAASPEFEKAVMPPVMVTLPGMDRVRLWREIDYAKSPDPFVRMDVYAPPGKLERRGAVLFIHGGVSTKGQAKDWGIYQSWGRLAAASGLVGVTFTQRLGFPETQINEAASDVAAAIAYVRANAATYGIDPNRICLAAFSAGGPMLSPYMSAAPDHVRCLVSVYTFLDIRQTKEHQAAETPETLNAYSPILKLAGAGRKTPLLILRAGADSIPTLLDSADRFAAEALKADYPMTLINLPGAPHGFDNKAWNARGEEAIIETLAFLKRHLGQE
ncbi:MAG: alpha/beta hydrolase [Alphaproteobacteria bacterium]|nr:alpha/beta hydrolase [Alphaproteobacteria bacterium]